MLFALSIAAAILLGIIGFVLLLVGVYFLLFTMIPERSGSTTLGDLMGASSAPKMRFEPRNLLVGLVLLTAAAGCSLGAWFIWP